MSGPEPQSDRSPARAPSCLRSRMSDHRLHREIPPNPTGRDFVVGDLHGQQAMLDCLLQHVSFQEESDRLFSLGDLVDRGPDNDALMHRFATRPSHFAIRGNHEALVQAARRNSLYEKVWERNGGRWGRELPPGRLDEIDAFIDTLPYAIELSLQDGRRIGLIHAEVKPGAGWQDIRELGAHFEDTIDDGGSTLAASALWGRQRHRIADFIANQPEGATLAPEERAALAAKLRPVEGIDLVYVGHTIIGNRKPMRVGNVLFVDTGAYLTTGRLTLVEPLQDHYWQVTAGAEPKLVKGGPRKLPDAAEIPPAYAAS